MLKISLHLNTFESFNVALQRHLILKIIKMKKLILIAIAMFTLNGMAQEKKIKASSGEKITKVKQTKSAEDIASAETKKMMLQLDLTKDQQTKVYNVLLERAKANLETRAERQKIKASKKEVTKEDYKKIRAKIVKQRDETHMKMKEILTAEQYTKYEEAFGKRPKVKVKSN